jgi:trehalose-6-phosphate synthase
LSGIIYYMGKPIIHIAIANAAPITYDPKTNTIIRKPGGVSTVLENIEYDALVVLDPTGKLDGYVDATGRKVFGVTVTAQEYRQYYGEYSNRVLWNVLHAPTGRYKYVRLEDPEFSYAQYRMVNQKVVDRALQAFQEVAPTAPSHSARFRFIDYHLLPAAAMLKQRLPGAKSSYTNYIPWTDAGVITSSSMAELLPPQQLRQLLKGMLHNELINFQTHKDLINFRETIRILFVHNAQNVDPLVTIDYKRIRYGTHLTQLHVLPASLNYKKIAESVDDAKARKMSQAFRTQYPEEKIAYAMDRTDYIKGPDKHILSVKEMLLTHPELLGRFRLVQGLPASRLNIKEYKEFSDSIHDLARQTNKVLRQHFQKFSPKAYGGNKSWQPITIDTRALPNDQVLANFRASDVVLVLSVIDGLNLVAEETLLCQQLEVHAVPVIIGKNVGLTEQLARVNYTYIVDPQDIHACAEAIYNALMEPQSEHRIAIQKVKDYFSQHDATRQSKEYQRVFEKAIKQSGDA